MWCSVPRALGDKCTPVGLLQFFTSLPICPSSSVAPFKYIQMSVLPNPLGGQRARCVACPFLIFQRARAGRVRISGFAICVFFPPQGSAYSNLLHTHPHGEDLTVRIASEADLKRNSRYKHVAILVIWKQQFFFFLRHLGDGKRGILSF